MSSRDKPASPAAPRAQMSHGVIQLVRHIDEQNLPAGVSAEDIAALRSFWADGPSYKEYELREKPQLRAEADAYFCKKFSEHPVRLDIALGGRTALLSAIEDKMEGLAHLMLDNVEREGKLEQLLYAVRTHCYHAGHLALMRDMPEVATRIMHMLEPYPDLLETFVNDADHNNKSFLELCCPESRRHGGSGMTIDPQMMPALMWLAGRGVPMHSSGYRGKTFLHLLMEAKSFRDMPEMQRLAEEIIRNGCVSVNAQDDAGMTPYTLAVKAGAYGLADRLMSSYGARADILIQQKDAPTPAVLESGKAEEIGDRLEQLIANKLIPDDQLRRIVRYSHSKFTGFHDMLNEFAYKVIYPAALMEMGYGQDQELTAWVKNPENGKDFLDRFYTNSACLSEALRQALSPTPLSMPESGRPHALSADIRHVMRLPRLSRTWHHPTISFPQELRKLRPNRHWVSILKQSFPAHADHTLHLQCLTSSDELREESRSLEHCVGNSDYDKQCCEESNEKRCHILSVRDKDGTALGTLEIKIVPLQATKNLLSANDLLNHERAEGYAVAIGGSGYAMQVEQFKGKGNGRPPEKAIGLWRDFVQAMQEAPQQWLEVEGICQERLPKESRKPEAVLGEIVSEAKEEQEIGALIRDHIHYDPMDPSEWTDPTTPEPWEVINKRFDVYRSPERRATLKTDGRKRVYDDAQGQEPNHFIAGYAGRQSPPSAKLTGSPGRRECGLFREDVKRDDVVALQSLDVRSWLRATGLMDAIHGHIRGQFPEIAKEREAVWAREEKEATMVLRAVPEGRDERRQRIQSHESRSENLTAQDRRERQPYFGGR